MAASDLLSPDEFAVLKQILQALNLALAQNTAGKAKRRKQRALVQARKQQSVVEAGLRRRTDRPLRTTGAG